MPGSGGPANTVSVAEVHNWLNTPKRLVRQPKWTPKLTNHEPSWFIFESAVEANGEVQEGCGFITQWRPAQRADPERFSFVLFLRKRRVYAWDIDPTARHKNKRAGEGWPWFGHQVRGHHVHYWAAEGEGYAEPLQLEDDFFCPAWDAFLRAASIEPVTCVDPNPDRRFGQMSLLE